MIIWKYRRFPRRHDRSSRTRRYRGFTLVELMIASLLTSVVMMIAWTGLLSIINMNNEAQAITARKLEMTRAIDMITQEVRQAQAINRSGTVEANGSTVSIEDVVINSGLTMADLGTPGELGLYLEIPTNSNITSCSTNTGPVAAEKFDRVVYDVRRSPEAWLTPKVVARYGRIPSVDGSIDPCSAPIANDIVADAIAQTNKDPECVGVLSGSDGFHTCQRGDAVDLLFKSAIRDVEEIPASSSVTSRSFEFLPAEAELTPGEASALVLTVQPKIARDTFSLSWLWTGEPPTLDGPYIVRISSPRRNLNYLAGNNLELQNLNLANGESGEIACYRIEVSIQDGGSVNSNQECFTLEGPHHVGDGGHGNGDDDDDDDD